MAMAPAPSIWHDPATWWVIAFLAPGLIVAFFEDAGTWFILKWLGRIAILLLMIPLAFLAWYMAVLIPVSIAIILGAVIIVCGMRSSTGRMRRLMGRIPEEDRHQARERRTPLHSLDGE